MPQVLQETSVKLLLIIADEMEKCLQITEDQWLERSAPGKWSRKEILGHLVDSAANNHLRFVRAQFADTDFITIAYEQNHFVASQYYQGSNIGDLLTLWHSYNRHLAHVIKHIDPSKLDITCHIGSYPPVPLSLVVTDYVTHLDHHLAQIFNKG